MAIDVHDDLPPSPTLTNPDMILPSRPGDSILFMSANAVATSGSSPYRRPPAHPQTYQRTTPPESRSLDMAKYHPAPAPVSPAQTLAPILVHASSPLEAIDEIDTTPTRRAYGAPSGALTSSPTLRMLGDSNGDWPLKNGRRLSGVSNASSSVHSEDLEQWAANKAAMAGVDVDESVVTLDEDEDQFGQFAKQNDIDGDMENDAWPIKRDDTDDDFLSRRAEIILANAKKRLNMMEGNLKGARYSLSSGSISNRFSYASSRPRQSSILGKRITPSHSRAASEASMPSPLPSLPAPRPKNTLPKRSSSALGSFAGGLSILDRTPSLRGVRSQEAMRETRLKNWVMDDRIPSSPSDMPRAASSIEHHVHTSRSSPTPSEMRRPVSQASSIRTQMNELKDRIAVIKEKAKSGKRTSTLSMRTPSPYGSEKIYAESYKSPRSVGTAKEITPNGSPVILDHPYSYTSDEYSSGSSRNVDDVVEYEESTYEDAEETLDELEEVLTNGTNHASNGLGIYPHNLGDPLLDEVIAEESEEYDGQSDAGQTEYYEAETAATERHEDRLDAFDYENFFLHSAMGTYSRDTRRDSLSSESSVETTRPASPLRNRDEDGSPVQSDLDPQVPDSPLENMLERNFSTASVSSFATFQTAADGLDEGEEPELDETGDLDVVTGVLISSMNHNLPVQQTISKQAISNPRASLTLSSPPTFLPSPPLSTSAAQRLSMNGRPSSALLSSFIGLDSVAASPDIIQRDRAVVESMVGALQRCCLELQRAQNDKRDLLREKLIEARRLLLEGLEEAEYSPA